MCSMTFGSDGRYMYVIDLVVYLCTRFLSSLKVAMYFYSP